MTRFEAQNFHNDMNAAIEAVLAKYHLTRVKSNLAYGEIESKYSITVEQLTENGEHKDDPITEMCLQDYFKNKLGLKNVPAKLLGARFTITGHNDIYTLTGFKANRPSYPVQFESPRGAKYKSSGIGFHFLND